MENSFTDRSKPILTAIKKAGLKVDKVDKRGKKTVITVTPAGKSKKVPDSQEDDQGASKKKGRKKSSG